MLRRRPQLVVVGSTLAVLLLHATSVAQARATDCADLLNTFLDASSNEAVPYTGDNLVFFLHIPRTAGRTFHNCLLKRGTAPAQRCPKSYDQLRIDDLSTPNCHLLSTHDDFSILQRLPHNTAVVTQLRDPVDRFLSSYEFAVELAAREITKSRRKRHKSRPAKPNKVKTENVWPWSQLIPWFVGNMEPRIEALSKQESAQPGVWTKQQTSDGRSFYWNQHQNKSKWALSSQEQQHVAPELDPFNNELFMPLEEFVQHPVAAELLHNGQLLQVLGLTNYSCWDKAAHLRSCFLQDASVAEQLLQFAMQRIERFTHVGDTGQLMHSAEAAAAALGMDLNKPAYSARDATDEQQYEAPADEPHPPHEPLANNDDDDDDDDDNGSSSSSRAAGDADRTALQRGNSLGREFQRCAARAQKRSRRARQRAMAVLKLADGRAVSFSKEARREIPAAVIEQIRHLNALDAQLYDRGLRLLQQNRQLFKSQRRLQKLNKPKASSRKSDSTRTAGTRLDDEL